MKMDALALGRRLDRHDFSSILMRLCTCAALVAW
jgi:hypothetical protein